MVSVVMTQKMTGTPDDIAAFSAPLVAPLTTASKCAVAPRTCAARRVPPQAPDQASTERCPIVKRAVRHLRYTHPRDCHMLA